MPSEKTTSHAFQADVKGNSFKLDKQGVIIVCRLLGITVFMLFLFLFGVILIGKFDEIKNDIKGIFLSMALLVGYIALGLLTTMLLKITKH